MAPRPLRREYYFDAGVHLAIRPQPEAGDDLIDQLLPTAHRLVVEDDARVTVWDASGRVIVAYRASQVVGWHALART